MFPLQSSSVGSALVCNHDGIVKKILRDDIGLDSEKKIVGLPITRLVDQRSLGKMLNFLVELRSNKAVYNWELNLPVPGNMLTLHFAGISSDKHLLIIVARTDGEMEKLYEEMLSINNEQANALRTAVKEKFVLSQPQTTRQDNELYNEISRLNNELVNLQRELTKQNAELEKLNNQKNAFLGMASHDLRNPLAHIISSSSILIDSTYDIPDDEQQTLLGIIQSSSRFMLNMVDDLLDVVTIESGKMNLQLSATDLAALIQENITRNKSLALDKGISVEFTVKHPLPIIDTDSSKLLQVLTNLLSNAIKYSPPNSTVQITTTVQPEYVVVAIKDQGHGIPKNELGKLFKPFSRTSVPTTAGEKSVGLGLMIVRRIVEAHQGKVWVDSEVGQGTTFFFSLPKKSDGVMSVPEKAAAPEQKQLTAEDLQALPADWLKAFTAAVEMLDPEKAKVIVSQISEEHPAIAGRLTHLIGQYRFDRLQSLLTMRTDL